MLNNDKGLQVHLFISRVHANSLAGTAQELTLRERSPAQELTWRERVVVESQCAFRTRLHRVR